MLVMILRRFDLLLKGCSIFCKTDEVSTFINNLNLASLQDVADCGGLSILFVCLLKAIFESHLGPRSV